VFVACRTKRAVLAKQTRRAAASRKAGRVGEKELALRWSEYMPSLVFSRVLYGEKERGQTMEITK
jgi:hypothetical protein